MAVWVTGKAAFAWNYQTSSVRRRKERSDERDVPDVLPQLFRLRYVEENGQAVSGQVHTFFGEVVQTECALRLLLELSTRQSQRELVVAAKSVCNVVDQLPREFEDAGHVVVFLCASSMLLEVLVGKGGCRTYVLILAVEVVPRKVWTAPLLH